RTPERSLAVRVRTDAARQGCARRRGRGHRIRELAAARPAGRPAWRRGAAAPRRDAGTRGGGARLRGDGAAHGPAAARARAVNDILKDPHVIRLHAVRYPDWTLRTGVERLGRHGHPVAGGARLGHTGAPAPALPVSRGRPTTGARAPGDP